LRIIAVPMMPMPTMPTRLAIPSSRTLAADQQTAITGPRQERFFCSTRVIEDLTSLADPGCYPDYLRQTKS
jgi:hypothetical protein